MRTPILSSSLLIFVFKRASSLATLTLIVLTSRENVYDVKIYNAVAYANANDKGVHTIKVSVAYATAL